ncbi:MAG: zinc metallopeptidase [Candidatus Spyradocola sp.]|jgi:Zn-dependent membrane protease YugP
MPFLYYGSWDYLWLILLAAVLGMIAQGAVQSTYRKYAGVAARSGVTADEVAQRILQDAGVYDVSIGYSNRGTLSDHYDPRAKALRLSNGVYGSTSIAALGIAAHEAGHAIQHAQGYAPLAIRNSIVPLVNFGSAASMPLLLIGLFLNSYILAMIGVVFYAFAVAFQLVTLPVELNASRRAMQALQNTGLLAPDEAAKTRKVLTAAASTYVAAAFAAVAQLLRLLSIANRQRRD